MLAGEENERIVHDGNNTIQIARLESVDNIDEKINIASTVGALGFHIR